MPDLEGGKTEEMPGRGKDKTKVSPPTPGTDDPGEGTSHSYYTRAAERKARKIEEQKTKEIEGQEVKELEKGKAKDKTKGTHTIAPLRQIMPIVGEQSRVKIPFTTCDLNSWRDEVKCFRKNPEGVTKRFELMAKNLDIDWEDIDLMLSELTETEKELKNRENTCCFTTREYWGDISYRKS
ncbi:hypothetical protein BTVI_45262 [Pitangus sulphuratus]|nr:hypothetical protein BTVI_45262 [Pitangus sulphuratus]